MKGVQYATATLECLRDYLPRPIKLYVDQSGRSLIPHAGGWMFFLVAKKHGMPYGYCSTLIEMDFDRLPQLFEKAVTEFRDYLEDK